MTEPRIPSPAWRLALPGKKNTVLLWLGDCRDITLGFLLSVPGQTMGMAVFADAFIEVWG